MAANGIPEALTARVRFLSVEQVIAMHDTLVDRYGGHPGGGARGARFEGVDAAVQAVKNSYYESLHESRRGVRRLHHPGPRVRGWEQRHGSGGDAGLSRGQ